MVLWVPFWTSFNMLIKSFINKLIKIIDKCSLYISYENDFSSFYFENLKLSFSTALCFCLWFTCKCLMKCVYVYVYGSVCMHTQFCPTLCNPIDCSPLGSSVHWIFQVGILEWVAISYSRWSSQPRDQTLFSCVCCIGGRFFTTAQLCLPTLHWILHLFVIYNC